MEWFVEWWKNLGLFLQIMYCVALPSTLVLLIQTVMIIIGFGGDGAGVNPSDTSGMDAMDSLGTLAGIDVGDSATINPEAIDPADGGNPADFGAMHFFTVQGFITFLCVFGWAGVITYTLTLNVIISIIVAFVLGLAAMFGVAKLLQLISRLAQNGTINVKNLLGATGTVYLVIPADGKGKVMINTDERCLEYEAITDSGETLGDGTAVRVIDIRTGNILVVEKV